MKELFHNKSPWIFLEFFKINYVGAFKIFGNSFFVIVFNSGSKEYVVFAFTSSFKDSRHTTIAMTFDIFDK